MPMPHRTQMQLIKRRLVGKDGSERVRELRAILAELPGYRNGPYADLRKWVEGELTAARTRKRVVHRDSIAVRREGAAQRRRDLLLPCVQPPARRARDDQGRGRRSRDGAARAPGRYEVQRGAAA